MRGFFRALGLRNLFRRHAKTSSPPADTSVRSHVVDHMQQKYRESLRQFSIDEVQRHYQRVRRPSQFHYDDDEDEALEQQQRVYDSMGERPPFLFFCGSDQTTTSNHTPMSRFTDVEDDFPSIHTRQAVQTFTPLISHQMPVFFAPRHAFAHEA